MIADQNHFVIPVKNLEERERWSSGQVPLVYPDAVCMGKKEQADPDDFLTLQVLLHDAWHDVGNMAKLAAQLMLLCHIFWLTTVRTRSNKALARRWP